MPVAESLRVGAQAAAKRDVRSHKSPTAVADQTLRHLCSQRSNSVTLARSNAMACSVQACRSISTRAPDIRNTLNSFGSPRTRVDVAVPAEMASAPKPSITGDGGAYSPL